jgi:hypothetical protein
VGCKKCPAFSVCPLKGTIGDHKPEADASASASNKAKPAAKAQKKP